MHSEALVGATNWYDPVVSGLPRMILCPVALFTVISTPVCSTGETVGLGSVRLKLSAKGLARARAIHDPEFTPANSTTETSVIDAQPSKRRTLADDRARNVRKASIASNREIVPMAHGGTGTGTDTAVASAANGIVTVCASAPAHGRSSADSTARTLVESANLSDTRRRCNSMKILPVLRTNCRNNSDPLADGGHHEMQPKKRSPGLEPISLYS